MTMPMHDITTRAARPAMAALIAAGTSAALLLGAHAFERIGQMAPCMLCLDQRDAHWTALAAALITLGLNRFWPADRAVAAGLGVTALIYLFSTGLAVYHAGVEWKLWPGPATCSGAMQIGSVDELMTRLETAPIVSCSEAAWRLFGMSMAGYNAIISLALASLTGWAAVRLFRSLRMPAFAGS